MRYYPSGRHPYIDFLSDLDRQAYVSNADVNWPSDVQGAITRLRKLLDKKTGEQQVHDFLEEHPYLLPGFGDLHHGPYGGVVVTKFPLSTSFVTDFAYISSNSQTL